MDKKKSLLKGIFDKLGKKKEKKSYGDENAYKGLRNSLPKVEKIPSRYPSLKEGISTKV